MLRADAHSDGVITLDTRAGRRYRLILDLARDVTAKLDLQAVLDSTFVALRQLLEFGGGSIALVEDGYLAFAATDPPATTEALAMRIPVGQGVSGRIAASGEPAYIPDILDDPSVTPERRKKATSSGLRTYFGVPLITEGHPIGVLQVDSTEVDAFDEEDRLLLLAFTPIVAAAVQNARVYGREAAALAKLRELDARHRDFVALVSHELRTPLTAVIGYADTVLERSDLLSPREVLALVARCRRSASRLAALVEQLLDLSVIEGDRLRLQPVPVDVAALLEEMADEYVSHDHVVTVSVQPGLPAMRLDRLRMTQILGNLLTNAAKFSSSDAPVELAAGVHDDALVLTVTDHGPGIPEADRERIFDRFAQLEQTGVREHGGFGIGLYVVRRLVTAMRGTVSVTCPPAGGTTFEVRLPSRNPLDVSHAN